MATAARIFGVLLAVLGLAYGAVAVYGLFNVESAATVLEMMKAPEQKEFGFRSIDEWKQGVWFNSWLFFAVGTAAAVCGIGIAALKDWARRSWLAASVVLVIFVVIVLVWSGDDTWKRYVELLAIALPSFPLLLRRFQVEGRAI
jgi:hypothetical protein